MGIIEMMTQVRLEEAKRSIIYHTTTSTCDNNTIREIVIRLDLSIKVDFREDILLVLESGQVKRLSAPPFCERTCKYCPIIAIQIDLA